MRKPAGAAKAAPRVRKAPAATTQASAAPPPPIEISLPDITARLLAIAALGEASGAGPMLSLARAALMDAARLNGLAGEGRNTGAAIEDLLERLDAEDNGTGQRGDTATPSD